MKRIFTYRRQRPIKGGRTPLPACVEKQLWREVDATASRFGTSRSFVVAVALAEAMGIDIKDDYRRRVRRSK